ncbi:MAG: hypothetical protein HQM16_18725 [Deltaproteobacteria bacterium]|nr:hypothetical protein [Deltaproteobacteria bacterium]
MDDLFCKTCGQPKDKTKFISGEYFERSLEGSTYLMRIENSKATVCGCIDCLGDFLKDNTCFVSAWSLDREEIKITFCDHINSPVKSAIKKILSRVRLSFVPKARRTNLKQLLLEKPYESKPTNPTDIQEACDTKSNRGHEKDHQPRRKNEPDPQRADERRD